jgi:hypothetical protein
MVRSYTHTIKLSDLYMKITDPATFGINESIKIASAFQRGDDEHGVWTFEARQNYIKSLKSCYPTGIITLVKEHAEAGQSSWYVLDGGNRLRAIRDFVKCEFGIVIEERADVIQFSDFTPQETADFNTLLIPCQFLTIERDDPDYTIADMFCSLNTSSTPLSNGELYKAHGWKKNNWAIEVAKKIIGDVWVSSINDARINTLRANWETVFGCITESKRSQNIAMMIGYIISAHTSDFEKFDANYKANKNTLSTLAEAPTEEKIDTIFTKLTYFVAIMKTIEWSNEKELFGRPTRGIPPKSKVAPIWKYICENEIDKHCENIIQFYTVHAKNNQDVRAEYIRRLTKNGDNHTTSTKIDRVQEYIISFNN